MLQELEQQLIELNSKLQEERLKKEAVMKSERYRELQEMISNATKEQAELLDSVPSSTGEYEEVKKQIMDEFKEKNLDQFGTLIAKFKTKSEVNNQKLLQILDIDEFLTLATVTQKALTDLGKDEKYKPIRKALEGCIVEVSKEISDIQFASL